MTYPDFGYASQQPAQAPPPPRRRSILPLLIGGFVAVFALCLVGAVLIGSDGDKAEPPGTGGQGAAVTSEAPRAAPKTVTPKGVPTRVGEGTFLVGKDVKAGTYKTAGAAEGSIPLCYWHTAADTTDNTIKEQGVTNAATEAGYVKLVKGDYFKTSGCKEWVKQ